MQENQWNLTLCQLSQIKFYCGKWHLSFALYSEVLQAVHNCQWLSSSDLAQDYLQMPVDEVDIHKTAFWAGLSGLYEFTRMPFGLSNSGSSFCHLMEMCLGDQQFVTLLLYLDDICIFAPSVDEMLDQIEIVYGRLKDFNLKIKPKKCHFPMQCGVSGICPICRWHLH